MGKKAEYILKLDSSLCIKLNGLSGHRVIDKSSRIISTLGNWSIYVLFLLLFMIISGKHPLIIARDYVCCATANMTLYKLIKNKVKRTRPFQSMEHVNKVMAPPDEFSFPSGHAGGAAVFFYCTLFHMSSVFALIFFIWMILIGFSRVYNGVHYPGDVLAGYTMGFIVTKSMLRLIYML